ECTSVRYDRTRDEQGITMQDRARRVPRADLRTVCHWAVRTSANHRQDGAGLSQEPQGQQAIVQRASLPELIVAQAAGALVEPVARGGSCNTSINPHNPIIRKLNSIQRADSSHGAATKK